MRKNKNIDLEGSGCNYTELSNLRAPRVFLTTYELTPAMGEVIVLPSLSRVWLFATPWTATRQVSLSFTISRRGCRKESFGAKSSRKQKDKVLGRTTFSPPALWDSDPLLSGRGGILELRLWCKTRAISRSWSQFSLSLQQSLKMKKNKSKLKYQSVSQ